MSFDEEHGSKRRKLEDLDLQDLLKVVYYDESKEPIDYGEALLAQLS